MFLDDDNFNWRADTGELDRTKAPHIQRDDIQLFSTWWTDFISINILRTDIVRIKASWIIHRLPRYLFKSWLKLKKFKWSESNKRRGCLAFSLLMRVYTSIGNFTEWRWITGCYLHLNLLFSLSFFARKG